MESNAGQARILTRLVSFLIRIFSKFGVYILV